MIGRKGARYAACQLALTDWIIAEFRKEQGIDLSTDAMALTRVREAAEKAVSALSSKASTEISLPFITADSAGPKHLKLELGRAKLQQLASGR